MSKRKSASLQQKAEGKLVLKNSLFQPYLLNWPQLRKGSNPIILKTITTFCENNSELQKEISANKKKFITDPSKNSDLRDCFTFGINAVTKKLEKQSLDLVLVCRSASPATITQHLISLSATRKTPAACISGLSKNLSSALNFKSILTVGITCSKENPAYEKVNSLVKSIIPHIEAIDLPWINAEFPNLKKSLKCPEKPTDNTVSSVLVPTVICINKSTANKKRRKK